MPSNSSKGRQIEPGSPLDTVRRVLGHRATQDHVNALIYFARNLEDVFPSSPVLKSRREVVKQKWRYRFQEADYPFVFNLLTLHEFLGGRPTETKDLIEAIRARKTNEVRKTIERRRREIGELRSTFADWSQLSGAWLTSVPSLDIDGTKLPTQATTDTGSGDPNDSLKRGELGNLRAAEALAEFATGKHSDSPEAIAEKAFYLLELKRPDLANDLLASAAAGDANNGAVAFVRALTLLADAERKRSQQYFHHEESGGGLPPIDAEEFYHEEQSRRMGREAEASNEEALKLLLTAFENWPARFQSKLSVDLFSWKRCVLDEALKLFNRGYGRSPEVLGRLKNLVELSWLNDGVKHVAPHTLGTYREFLVAAKESQASVFQDALENLRAAIKRPHPSYRLQWLDRPDMSDWAPREDFSWSNEWPEALSAHAEDGLLAFFLAGRDHEARLKLESSWLLDKSAVEANTLLYRHHSRLLRMVRQLVPFGISLADYPANTAEKIASLAMSSLPWRESELSERLKIRWAYVLFQAYVIKALQAAGRGDREAALAAYQSAEATLSEWPKIIYKRKTHSYVQYPDDTHDVVDLLGNSGHLLRSSSRGWPNSFFVPDPKRDGSPRQEIIHIINTCESANGGCFFDQLGMFIRK